MTPLFSAILALFKLDQLESVYSDPLCARAIYRLLDETLQKIIDSILFIAGPLPFSHIRTLHKPDERAAWNRSLLLLKQLGLLQGRGQELWIHPGYQRALINGIALRQIAINCQSDSTMTDYEDLIYSITSSNSSKNADKELLSLFTSAGLLKGSDVTQAGFQFLVYPVTVQLWTVLAEWLMRNPDLANLKYLLHMSDGQVSASNNPSVIYKLGILHASSHQPTILHSCLTRTRINKDALKIIVETNYHLYAYSPTPLSLAILSLFSTPKDRLPNLLRARLTQDSVRGAFKRGISASQLLLYLSTHSPLPLPPTLTDQVALWEADMKRVKDADGYLYSQFNRQADFEAACKLAGQHLLYSNPNKRTLIVNEQGRSLLNN